MFKKFLTTRLKNVAMPVGVFFIFVLLWQYLDAAFNVPEVIFPSPLEIWSVSVANISVLLEQTMITSIEAISGFILGSVGALLIAVWFTYSKGSRRALYPYSIALKTAPLYALAPLLVLWFGNGMWSKIVMSALVAFFPVLVGSVSGFSAISRDELDLMKSLNASKRQIFFRLRLPKSLPLIFPALKISTTLSVVGAVIAEFTGSSQGIGYLIINSSYYLETSLMFAAIIMTSLLGIVFFGVVSLLEKKIVFWN